MWCSYIQHLLYVVKEHTLTPVRKNVTCKFEIFSFWLRAKRVYVTAKTKKMEALKRKFSKQKGSKNQKAAKGKQKPGKKKTKNKKS